MNEKIMAPCRPDGKVESTWPTDPEGKEPGEYAVIDNDSKDAECRCSLGSCCVDGGNYVIRTIS